MVMKMVVDIGIMHVGVSATIADPILKELAAPRDIKY
jgi:hypothetical protein